MNTTALRIARHTFVVLSTALTAAQALEWVKKRRRRNERSIQLRSGVVINDSVTEDEEHGSE